MMRLCACLREKTVKECIDVAKKIDTELIEHRIDYMTKPEDFKKIYQSIKVPVVATNRPVRSGGKFEGTEEDRIVLLLKAIYEGCAYVDVEIETDPYLMKKVIETARKNDCKVIISTHDYKKTPSKEELFEIMRTEKELGADIGKIATTANSIKDCYKVLGLLKEAQKENFPLIAFCMGKIGKFSRLMSLKHGAPFTYVAIKEGTAPGQIQLDDMKDRIKSMKCKLLVVIGDPIEHSLSPIMHNAALKKLKLDDEFDFRKIHVKSDELRAFVELIKAGEIFGANITIPHKISIMKYVDKVTKEAALVGAVNTLYQENDEIIGHITDGVGCMNALKDENFDVKGKKILLIGAGGASRAIGFSSALNGAKEIVILNRTVDRAKLLARDIKEKTRVEARANSLDNIEKEIKDADLLINLTSVGMKGELEDKSLVDPKLLHKKLAVMDIVYVPYMTKLLIAAKKKGCKIIPGLGMLVHQGAIGFKFWTGKKAPIDVMKNALKDVLE